MGATSADLRCPCGSTEFVVRANATQSVGLACCTNGHNAFLLDSRDVWFDVIQDSKPRQLHCRCKAHVFGLSVDYAFREGTQTVGAVSVHARCTACGAARDVFDVEIDYEPTDPLVARPLDPVDDPWLKAERVELTGLWQPRDFVRVLRFAADLPKARPLFALWGTPVRETPVDEVVQHSNPRASSPLCSRARRSNHPPS